MKMYNQAQWSEFKDKLALIKKDMRTHQMQEQTSNMMSDDVAENQDLHLLNLIFKTD